jgi:hypothetical protein
VGARLLLTRSGSFEVALACIRPRRRVGGERYSAASV